MKVLSGRLGVLLAVVALGLLVAGSAQAKDTGTVTISGKAYVFNHMSNYIEGAEIKVRELPGLSATTDANGDYELEVPDNATVTPYIDPPAGINEIDLQTMRTRGADIVNANFQTPADLEYKALSAILSVPIDAVSGRPSDCVIVTTASARNVRGVDYETFHERTPHGVAGATAQTTPLVPGPTYFNKHVIPDRNETSTSNDGGIIWTDVPAGTYRVETSSEATRFASFLATCEPGRVVNANPPWGAYELSPGEKPLGASMAAAGVFSLKARKGKRRKVVAKVESAEPVAVKAVLKKGEKRLGTRKATLEGPGRAKLVFPLRKRKPKGKGTLRIAYTDSVGGRIVEAHRVRIPKAKGRK